MSEGIPAYSNFWKKLFDHMIDGSDRLEKQIRGEPDMAKRAALAAAAMALLAACSAIAFLVNTES